MTATPSLKVEYRNTADLIPYVNNARTHNDQQVSQIAASIKEFGFNNPILLDGENGVIAGHGRLLAAKKLGMQTVPCIELKHLSETQKKAYILADNRLAELAEWDTEMLNMELGDLSTEGFDIDLTGFSLDDLNISDSDGGGELDDPAAELRDSTKVNSGDVWQLGRHRLMCGDSTNAADVTALTNGDHIDICFTSPPYNADVTVSIKKEKAVSKYQNSHDNYKADDYTRFLISFTHNALSVCDYVFVNVQSLGNNKLSLIDYMYSMRENYADTVIWDKMTPLPALRENVLNSDFEYVHVFSDKGSRVIGTVPFHGNLENIIHIQRVHHNEYADIHRAVFPLEFAAHFVQHFAKDSVLDLFGGTGTTLIAAEQLNKRAYLMELDPLYCDVIIRRWQELTNQTAVRSDGVKYMDL